MKFKTIFFGAIGFVVLFGVLRPAPFFKGLQPAISPPKKDITESFSPTDPNTTNLPLSLPDGFNISIFAKDLSGPRVLIWDPNGVLLTSIPSSGKVVALPDENNDGQSDKTITVIDGLERPHGLAFHNGKLYIAETHSVGVYDYDIVQKKASGRKKIVDLPGGGNHFSRTIGFGPDGRLYVSVGSSCNVCVEKDNRRAKVLVANDDGSNLKDFATGLRNSVFFVWHPETKAMWATDMGRDLLGDDIPPDEINILEEDKFYGWPYCYGKNIFDASFDRTAGSRCANAVGSHANLQAHSAPLGLVFIPTNSSWPKEYWGNLLVAFHGSWNRSEPTGYKVVRLKYPSTPVEQVDFVSGWLEGGNALGRPVDLLLNTSGALFISDDKAGVIYRISPQNL